MKELIVDDNALYFVEGGLPEDSNDDPDSKHAIVRIGHDGEDRTVLRANDVVGYLELLAYGERVYI